MSFGCFLAYKTADRFFNQPEGGQQQICCLLIPLYKVDFFPGRNCYTIAASNCIIH